MVTPRICRITLFLVGALLSAQASAQLNGHNLRGDYMTEGDTFTLAVTFPFGG